MLGGVAGYSGTRDYIQRRAKFLAALFFMSGTTIALVILGYVAGFIGQVAQDVMGKYWKVFAGLVAIVVALAALNLLPFTLPSHIVTSKTPPTCFL